MTLEEMNADYEQKEARKLKPRKPAQENCCESAFSGGGLHPVFLVEDEETNTVSYMTLDDDGDMIPL